MTLSIWALDPSGVRRGVLKALSASAVLRDSDLGTWQITAVGDLADEVTIDWTLILQDGDQLVLSGPVRSAGAQYDSGWVRTLSGVTDLAALDAVLTYPDPSKAATQQAADGQYTAKGPAETVIRDMVHRNAGTGAIAARRQSAFTVTASQGRGTVVSLATQMQNVLTEATRMARAGGVAFDAVWDESAVAAVLRFRARADRSRLVRFTGVNGGAADGEWSMTAPTATAAIVRGQGEGTYKNVREYTRAGRRVEVFVDQSSTDDDEAIKTAADEALDSGRATATATFKAVEVEGCRLGVDFFLGDTISVEFGPVTISEVASQADITWDEYGRQVQLTLGTHESDADADTAWVNHVRALDARVRRQEVR